MHCINKIQILKIFNSNIFNFKFNRKGTHVTTSKPFCWDSCILLCSLSILSRVSDLGTVFPSTWDPILREWMRLQQLPFRVHQSSGSCKKMGGKMATSKEVLKWRQQVSWSVSLHFISGDSSSTFWMLLIQNNCINGTYLKKDKRNNIIKKMDLLKLKESFWSSECW